MEYDEIINLDIMSMQNDMESWLVPEQEITDYEHYSKALLDEFYDLITQVYKNKYQGYMFPDGRYANLFGSHLSVHPIIQHKYGFDPDVLDYPLFFGCVRVGCMEARDTLATYIETMYKPTNAAHEAILDYFYSQKRVALITIEVQNSKLYGKRLKHILDKDFDCDVEVVA